MSKTIENGYDDMRKITRKLLASKAWSRWPVLPVKRPLACVPEGERTSEDAEGWPQCGVMFDFDIAECFLTVFITNMYTIVDKTFQEVIDDKAIVRVAYPSVDALLDAGWIVD